MKILLIGDGNSIHLVNYIRVVLFKRPHLKLTLFDMNNNTNVNKESYEFYEEMKVEIINQNKMEDLIQSEIIKKIPKIRSVAYQRELAKKLKKVGEFDYCLVHYVDKVKANIVSINKKYYRKIIPIFWGSDLLRNKSLKNKSYKILFSNADHIIFNTENMYNHFNNYYGDKFSEKSRVIKFPTMSFEKLDKLKKNHTNEQMIQELNLPLNKNIILCGHSANFAEQHEKLIEEISKCSPGVLKTSYFIFPLTYGELSTTNYHEKIKKMLTEKGINGEILPHYIENEKMLKYVIVTDVYISVITTDAFSSVMQENLYSGSHLIYGKWLNYIELKKDEIVASIINEISDIPKTLEVIIRNKENIEHKLIENKKKIYNISSPEKISNTWKEILDNNY